MSERQESVEAFKSVVNSVIDHESQRYHQLDIQIFGLVGSAKVTRVQKGGRTFVSLGRCDSIPTALALGRHEHQWGIIKDGRIGSWAGRVALVARTGQTESLTRAWHFPTNFVGAVTERLLTDPEELEMALEWARSPRLHPHHLAELAVLSATETAAVTTIIEEDRHTEEELTEHLIENDECLQRSAISARSDYVY